MGVYCFRVEKGKEKRQHVDIPGNVFQAEQAASAEALG